MIVNRRTFIVKRGCLEDARALAMSLREFEQIRKLSAYRLYLPNIGAFDQIAMEAEFESLEEYEAWWNEWASSPEAAAFFEKWFDLTETGGVNEIWTLSE